MSSSSQLLSSDFIFLYVKFYVKFCEKFHNSSSRTIKYVKFCEPKINADSVGGLCEPKINSDSIGDLNLSNSNTLMWNCSSFSSFGLVLGYVPAAFRRQQSLSRCKKKKKFVRFVSKDSKIGLMFRFLIQLDCSRAAYCGNKCQSDVFQICRSENYIPKDADNYYHVHPLHQDKTRSCPP